MRKNYRVKSEKDFKAIFKDGQNFANRKFVVYKLEKDQRHFRVGISVSKKLGNAVVRNSIKRKTSRLRLLAVPKLARLAQLLPKSRKRVKVRQSFLLKQVVRTLLSLAVRSLRSQQPRSLLLSQKARGKKSLSQPLV